MPNQGDFTTPPLRTTPRTPAEARLLRFVYEREQQREKALALRQSMSRKARRRQRRKEVATGD